MDITIREIVKLVCNIVGYNCEINYNTSMPDCTPHKLLDVPRLEKLGWRNKKSLKKG